MQNQLNLIRRIEYDAYRMDLENTKPETAATSPAGEEAQKSFTKHKDSYEKLRADVAVKMQFLDENRVSPYSFAKLFAMFLRPRILNRSK